MKKYEFNLFIIICVIILSLIIICVLISFTVDDNTLNIEQTESQINQIELLDRHITDDNEYEILYSITYSNGITLQIWKEVDYNEYIELWEENKYDENCFKN